VKSAEIRYNLELDELRNIERQLANCTIVAPQDGQLVYANVNNGGSNNFIVEPGAMVRERQVIFRLPDPAHMQVDANIHESRITLVSAGMPVTIHLDAFPELKLKGSVAKVNEYPEPTTWFGSQVKKYGATVTIENPPPDLRKGLTAEVRIEIGSRDAAVQVPLQAIHDHGDRHYCFVKRNGMWSAREVEVGAANDQYAAIGSGLAVDEVVAMNPKPLLEFVSLPESDSSDKDESSALALQKASSPSATTPAGESDSNAKQKPDDRSSAKPADTARNDMLLKKPVSMLLTRDNSK